MTQSGRRKFSLGDIVRKLNEESPAHPVKETEQESESSHSQPPQALPATSIGGELPTQPRFSEGTESVSRSSSSEVPTQTRPVAKAEEQVSAAVPTSGSNAGATSPLFEEDEEEQFDIFRYVGVLYRRKVIILVCALLATLHGLHAYLTSAHYYVANARMLFSPGYQEIVSDQGIPWEIWGDREKRINTHLELLRSNVEVHRRLSENLGGRIAVSAIKGAGLKVKRGETNGEKNNIIELSFTHTDATLARDVLNGLCSEYINYIQEVNAQDITRMLAKFHAQIQKTQAELTYKEDALRQFKEKNQFVRLSAETDLVVSKLSTLEIALQETELQLVESRDRLSAMNAQIGQQEVNVIQSITYEDPYRNRLADLEFELNTLLAEYSADHFKVKSVQQQIDKMKEVISANVKKRARTETFVKNPIRESLLQSVVELSIERASLETKRISQQRLVEQLKQDLLRLPQVEQQFITLQRETESLVNTLSMLRERYERAKIKRDSQDSDLKILEPAQTPTVSFSSVKSSKILFGLLIGVVLGIALAFALEYFDQTVKEPRDVERTLEIPLLGIVPFIEADGALIEGLLDKGKTVLEPFRALRANLKHIAAQNNYRTFMICSALKGEGKTTLAANLAITFAMDGKKVILVDGDLRRSQLHALFNMPKEVGFSEYMAGVVEVDQIVKKTKHENLAIVTAGVRPHNPSELMGTVRFDHMLNELKQRADYIIYDSPALLPVSDGLIMAPKIDCCLMLARTLWTPLKGAKQAQMQLRRIGSNVVGAILNGVAHSRGYYPYYYGYYGYYSYSYKYSYDEDKEHSGPLRAMGLAVENRLKGGLQELQSIVPRLGTMTMFFVRSLVRRKLLWVLVALLGVSSALRFVFRDAQPLSSFRSPEYIGELPDSVKMQRIEGYSQQPFDNPGSVNQVHESGLLDSLKLWIASFQSRDAFRLAQFYDTAEFVFPGQRRGEGRQLLLDSLRRMVAVSGSATVDTVWAMPAGKGAFRSVAELSIGGAGEVSKVRFEQLWTLANGQWRIIREQKGARQ